MKYFFVLVASLTSFFTQAQVLDPAEWLLQTSKAEVSQGEELDLIFKVVLENTWYIYSSDFSKDVGPKVTEFRFVPNESYELVGDIVPVNPKSKYDDIFEGEVSYFEYEAEFRQTIKVLSTNPVIKGEYEYQVCTTVDGKCIPGDGEFEFLDIKVSAAEVVAQKEVVEEKAKETVVENVKEKAVEKTEESTQQTELASVKKEGPQKATTTLQKMEENEEIPGMVIDSPNAVVESADSIITVIADEESPIENKVPGNKITPAEDGSLFRFAFLAFLAGLAALLTPCVFPMIPMTVTFFTKSSTSQADSIKKGIIYGISIIVIYTLSGTIVSWINGPEFANWLSTHWLPNLFFFGVFVIFALSFLGLFEITLPSRFVNKVDKQSDRGGYLGVFFMAFTIVLVSFSCTGPIVGSILVASAGGAVIKPIVGMFSFSLALALPFSIFAIFPHWMQKLPKSGGWLNSVKVVLGFLELALGLKFLSIADQVYHWGILDREVYLAIWIVIFALTGFYLLGKITLPHDSKVEKTGVIRLMLAIITFSFVVYLIPGMFGAPLKALAGYLPPVASMDFSLSNGQGYAPVSEGNQLCDPPKYADILHFPYGIQGYFDLNQAVRCSKEQDKPIFIDFTGHGCVNCREMEARVWSDPVVLKILKEKYIVVALYVDDKTELPKSDWYTSSYDNKVKKTIGKQNADYQITKYTNNAQPLYVLMDSDQNLLVEPKAYDLSIPNFIQFLNEGLLNYTKKEG